MSEKIIKQTCLVYSNKSENSNKYYIMEIKEEDGSLYYVTKYGRLGRKPTIKKVPVKSLSIGQSLLSDAYFKKTRKGYVKTDMDEIIATGDAFFFS